MGGSHVRERNRGLVALTAVLGLLAAGCSSTLERTDANNALDFGVEAGAAVGGASGESGGVPPDATTAAASAPPGARDVPVGSATSDGASAGRAATAPGSPTGATGAVSALPAGRPIKVGAYGLSAGNASLATGASIGDAEKMSTAVANWVNAHGGAGGRPIELVQAVTDASSSTPIEQQDQAACAKFTEDQHVEVVVSIVVTSPTFYDCLAKANTPYIANTITGPDSAYYDTHPVFSTSPTKDRVALNQVEALVQMGYFKDPGAKVGIVYADHPWWTSAAKVFKDQAGTHGVAIADEFAICKPCSTDQQTNEARNAVLRFQGAGITHVVFVTDLQSGVLSFITAAESNGYFPRYGLESQALPAVLALALSPTTLQNSVGMGYTPATDVEEAQDVAETAPMKLCKQIMADSGQTASNRLHLEVQRYTCDGYFFLKFLLDRNGGRSDMSSIIAAVDAVGSAYQPTMTWKAYFGPGRHDGNQTWRPLAYEIACKCYQYAGEETEMLPLPGQPR